MTYCRSCKSQDISEHSAMEAYKYKGNPYDVLTEYSVCGQCEAEFITAEQISVNEKRIREAKKSLDGLLSSNEVYQIRIKLGLTQEDAARLFGGGANAFSKYERGEVTQSTAMDKLIRLAAESGFIKKRLEQMAGLEDAVPLALNIEHESPQFKTFNSKSRTLAHSANDITYRRNSSKFSSSFQVYRECEATAL